MFVLVAVRGGKDASNTKLFFPVSQIFLDYL